MSRRVRPRKRAGAPGAAAVLGMVAAVALTAAPGACWGVGRAGTPSHRAPMLEDHHQDGDGADELPVFRDSLDPDLKPHIHNYQHEHWHTHRLADGTLIHHKHPHRHTYIHYGEDVTEHEKKTRVFADPLRDRPPLPANGLTHMFH